MNKDSLYNSELWTRFIKKFGTSVEEFELKTYPQFDPYFNFLANSKDIQKLVADPELKKVSQHSFIPFVKILTKTPRYRWQEDDGEYMLETKTRPIAFASHFDTYLYAFYAFALTEKYQSYIHSKGFQECVLAYRTDLNGKCNIQFAKEVFDDIRDRLKTKKTCSVIALDITGYFDNIDHKILKEKWCKILGVSELPIDQYKVFRSLTNYSYVSKDSVLSHFGVDLKQLKADGVKWQTLLDLIPDHIAGTSFKEKFEVLKERKLVVKNLPKKAGDELQHRGIPQGSAMSALLSNVYLIDFDTWLWELGQKQGFTYKRYCDDLIVICDPDQVVEINNKILAEVEKYKLKIQNKKTEHIEFTQDSKGKTRAFNKKQILKDRVKVNSANEQTYYKNLQYLGFEFNGQNIYIRPGSLSRYFIKMRRRIINTIVMAYSNKSRVNKIKRGQIYFRYSHFGTRNFITYAKNSAKAFYKNSEGELKPGMNSRSINMQIAQHVKIIEQEISKKSHSRYEYKKYDRKRKRDVGQKQKHIALKK